jgi:hypothetical protein
MANPNALAFTNTGAQYALTFMATESGDSGLLTEADTCSPSGGVIATIAPPSSAGPNVTFTVTPQSSGTCTITVRDAFGQTAVVSITVTATTLTVQSHPNQRH